MDPVINWKYGLARTRLPFTYQKAQDHLAIVQAINFSAHSCKKTVCKLIQKMALNVGYSFHQTSCGVELDGDSFGVSKATSLPPQCDQFEIIAVFSLGSHIVHRRE